MKPTPSVPGTVYRGQPHATLTVEPTRLGTGEIELWIAVGGSESATLRLTPSAARTLAEDLQRRADVAATPTTADHPNQYTRREAHR